MKWCKNASFLITILSLLVPSYVYLSVLSSHTKLVEDRGVYDDICYLRQAALFRAHGVISGLDTDNAAARYGMALIRQAGLDGKLESTVPCHNLLSVTNKYAMQYPPGTGFLLSAFPEGSQASGLYIASSSAIFFMLMWLIATSRSYVAVGVFGGVGALTLYLMVNPAKASYSIAPTMPLCIALAYITVNTFSEASSVRRLILAVSAGLLLGLATDIRLSSVLLAFGYGVAFVIQFLRNRTGTMFMQPIVFGVALMIGALPTFAANVINGGSPFTTAYGGADTAPPLTSLDPLLAQLRWYLFSGTHSVLTWLALMLLIALAMVTAKKKLPILQLPLLVAFMTLLANDMYFITHPIQSQYYSVPPAILALWIGTFVLTCLLNSQETGLATPFVRLSASVAVTTALAAVVLLTYSGMFSRPQFVQSTAIESDAVIWIGGATWREAWKADGLGLGFQYRFQRHAVAGLGTLPISDQNKAIDAVVTDSRPQYIVANDQQMRDVIARLSDLGWVSSAGRAFDAEVYRVTKPASYSGHASSGQ